MENAPNWKESAATESEADVSAIFVCMMCNVLTKIYFICFVCATDQSRERA